MHLFVFHEISFVVNFVKKNSKLEFENILTFWCILMNENYLTRFSLVGRLIHLVLVLACNQFVFFSHVSLHPKVIYLVFLPSKKNIFHSDFSQQHSCCITAVSRFTLESINYIFCAWPQYI